MALYLASYDIKEEDRDEYQELWDYFDQLGAARILYSEYAVPFKGRAFELTKAICKHLRPADRLLVCEFFDGGDTCAWLNLKIGDTAFQKLLKDYARTLN